MERFAQAYTAQLQDFARNVLAGPARADHHRRRHRSHPHRGGRGAGARVRPAGVAGGSVLAQGHGPTRHHSRRRRHHIRRRNLRRGSRSAPPPPPRPPLIVCSFSGFPGGPVTDRHLLDDSAWTEVGVVITIPVKAQHQHRASEHRVLHRLSSLWFVARLAGLRHRGAHVGGNASHPRPARVHWCLGSRSSADVSTAPVTVINPNFGGRACVDPVAGSNQWTASGVSGSRKGGRT